MRWRDPCPCNLGSASRSAVGAQVRCRSCSERRQWNGGMTLVAASPCRMHAAISRHALDAECGCASSTARRSQPHMDRRRRKGACQKRPLLGGRLHAFIHKPKASVSIEWSSSQTPAIPCRAVHRKSEKNAFPIRWANSKSAASSRRALAARKTSNARRPRWFGSRVGPTVIHVPDMPASAWSIIASFPSRVIRT